ncbi:MAG: hypothetical protein QG572_1179 [Pseudomonadota bacterium]|nr:hypothetical protein [Pseudomonadota bacterium]
MAQKPERSVTRTTPECALTPVTLATPENASHPVTPAKAGVQGRRMGRLGRSYWTPAFAGVTETTGITTTLRTTATLTTNLSKGHPAP